MLLGILCDAWLHYKFLAYQQMKTIVYTCVRMYVRLFKHILVKARYYSPLGTINSIQNNPQGSTRTGQTFLYQRKFLKSNRNILYRTEKLDIERNNLIHQAERIVTKRKYLLLNGKNLYLMEITFTKIFFSLMYEKIP